MTPALREKASELTAGLSSDEAKARALYAFVAMKFRYISISLGAGRYRPHSAAEVLSNQYGDCKDKHTLLTALLQAAGIQAWPALLGVGLKFDPAIPSPAQFNHVVSVIPQGSGKYLWLDTTAEVAPFEFLTLATRDQQALLIPVQGKPLLLRTPVDPPFPSSGTVNVKSSLDANGTLTGHFEYHLTDDAAFATRGAFWQLAPPQWQELAQRMSQSLHYGGEVSRVEVANLEDSDKPFHLSYDYTRKNYSDWQEHKITPPVPPLGFGPGDEAEKPKEPFWAGAPGVLTYSSTLQLPKAFALAPPPEVNLTSSFADYAAHYSFRDGSFLCERKLTIKKSKIALEQWGEYQKFAKGIREDQTRFIDVSDAPAAPAVDPDVNPQAADLLRRSYDALQTGNLTEYQDLSSQAEQISPRQPGLWSLRAFYALMAGKTEEAIADGQKEIQFHPKFTTAYQALAEIETRLHRIDDAIALLRTAISIEPANERLVLQIADLLGREKRFAELQAILARILPAAPGNERLKTLYVRTLFRTGQKTQAIEEAGTVAAATSDSTTLNDLAYESAEAGVLTGSTLEWARKAVSQTELAASRATLSGIDTSALQTVSSLGNEWDTLGWILFKQGKIEDSAQYLKAAWQFDQHAAVGDHLGQLYDKQGNHTYAIHMYRLALASNHNYDDAQHHLRADGALVQQPPDKGTRRPLTAEEELVRTRTIDVPDLPQQTGSVEFFVLLAKGGIAEARYISGLETLKNAAHMLQKVPYRFPFPDDETRILVRRGILSCSAYTKPNCQFTMLPPSTTTMAGAEQFLPTVTQPTLLYKVEPQYTKEALDANLEGTVYLSLLIDQEGVPQDIQVTRSLGLGLDESARECVSK